MSDLIERQVRYKQLARKLAEGSIVTDALARLIEQIIAEVHDSRIEPQASRIVELEEAMREAVADLACAMPEEAKRRLNAALAATNTDAAIRALPAPEVIVRIERGEGGLLHAIGDFGMISGESVAELCEAIPLAIAALQPGEIVMPTDRERAALARLIDPFSQGAPSNDAGEYAKSKIAELEAEVAELRRKLGSGCDARGGGDHAVIRQGRYTFCANCGESLRGIRYCHEPRAALATPDTGDA